MNYKIVSFFICFSIIFFQIESKNRGGVSTVQRVKAQTAAFFEEKIKNPVLCSYHISKAVIELFFEEKIQKRISASWNYFDKKTQHLFIFSLFLSCYYGIHILCYPGMTAPNSENITLNEKILGGISQGTASIIISMIAATISEKLNIIIHPDTYKHILLPIQ